VVERWNAALAAGRGALWSPTIRAAVTAGTPWLDMYCPGRRTTRPIDIRTIDRHPLASVGSLVLGLQLVVSWLGADARDHRLAREPACHQPEAIDDVRPATSAYPSIAGVAPSRGSNAMGQMPSTALSCQWRSRPQHQNGRQKDADNRRLSQGFNARPNDSQPRAPVTRGCRADGMQHRQGLPGPRR
jgi:hypothetical protein